MNLLLAAFRIVSSVLIFQQNAFGVLSAGPKIDTEEIVIGRSGKQYKIKSEKGATESKPVSIIDTEKMQERHVSDIKVRIENKVLISMWVPVEGSEVRIDFVPNKNTIWEDKVPYVVRGESSNTLRFASYGKQCHFTSKTPSALAHMSTCDGLLTGTIILKNEIYIVDPNFLRRVKVIGKENSTSPSSVENDITDQEAHFSNKNNINVTTGLMIDDEDQNNTIISELLPITNNTNDNTTFIEIIEHSPSDMEADRGFDDYLINLDNSNNNETTTSIIQSNETLLGEGNSEALYLYNETSKLPVGTTTTTAATVTSNTTAVKTTPKAIKKDSSSWEIVDKVFEASSHPEVVINWSVRQNDNRPDADDQEDIDLLEWSHPDAPLITHTIKKRSVKEALDPNFCGVSAIESVPLDPDEQQGMAVLANAHTVDYDRWSKDLVVELAVFVDNFLLNKYLTKFNNDKTRAQEKLQDFIASTLNNAQLMYQHESIRPKIQFKVVRYEVFETQPYQLNVGADADSYLKAFCSYQYDLRSQDVNWDHAVLFTGQDITRYNYYRGTDRTISGIARLNGVCNMQNSCLLAEAFDFNSAFIFAHEIGHSLGMGHDEPYCASTFIMSQSLGGGKVVWSPCSISSIQQYLNRLDLENRNCMLTLTQYKEPKFLLRTNDLPGVKYTASEQCTLMYGPDFYPEQSYSTDKDMCYLMWCRQRGSGQYITSHPALEGTACAFGRWCRSGQCVEKINVPPAPTHGGWTGWSAVNCQNCYCSDIDNSLAVVKSVRSCSNPLPSNGGAHCYGSNLRGLVCNRGCSTANSGRTKYTVDQYITLSCTDKKNKLYDANILGTGRQMTYYEDRACHIFCDVRTSDGGTKKTSWGDFLPDGTPCGNGRYCMEGKCMTLGCENTALVSTESECPAANEQKCVSALYQPQITWTGWSAWSTCSASCGSGIKKKARSCVTVPAGGSPSVLASGCYGHDAEKASCTLANCPHDQAAQRKSDYYRSKSSYDDKSNNREKPQYGFWSEWGPCSVTCGQGLQQRRRSCDSGGAGECFGPSTQERDCSAEVCPAWGGWGYWSNCDVTRYRRRVRKCYGGNEICPGNYLEVEYC